MSKKKKKDYFDLSVEEQKAQMEAFDALESGEISMLDIMNYDVPSGSAVNKKSDYTKQLENFLFADGETIDYTDKLESALIGDDDNIYPQSFKTDFEKMLDIEHKPSEIKREEISASVEENISETKTTYENGYVGQHFGHTEEFKVYDVEDGGIVNTQILSSNGQGHGMLAVVFQGNRSAGLN